MSRPAKVNAIGWEVATRSGDLSITSPDGTEVYIDNYTHAGDGPLLCTSDDVDIPVALVPLLLEASR